MGVEAHTSQGGPECRTIEPASLRGVAARCSSCVEERETFAQAAAWANVSKSTVWEWVAGGGPRAADERAIADVSGRSARAVRTALRAGCRPRKRPGSASCVSGRGGARGGSPKVEVGRPHSTVHAVLRRGGCSRRPRAERPAVVRYEWPCPGQLLHMDIKRFGRFEGPGHALTGDRRRRSRRAGWEYVHSIVDDCSPARLQRDPRRRKGRHRHRLHPPSAGLVPRARRSSPSG